MIPRDQQHIDPKTGDCFATCVASLLDLPRDEVPNFMLAGPGEEWWMELQRWLGNRGLQCAVTKVEVRRPETGYWIGSGRSPRGNYHHAVIMLGDDIAHDPHPSRDGLDGPVKFCYWITPISEETP